MQSEQIETDIINLGYLHGDSNGHSCGYCKQPLSFSAGFSCNLMNCATYQSLMDTGWRRCGTYYYKPNLFKSCCRMYTIRLNVQNYAIRKSHKKVLKQFEKLVYGIQTDKDIKQENIKIIKQEQQVKNEGNQQQLEEETKKQAQDQQKQKIDIQKLDEKDLQFISQIEQYMKQFLAQITNDVKVIIDLIGASQQKLNFIIDENMVNLIKVMKSNNNKKGDYFSNVLQILYGKNRDYFKVAKMDINQFIMKISQHCQQILQIIIQNNYLVQIEVSGQVTFFLPTHQDEAESKILRQQNKITQQSGQQQQQQKDPDNQQKQKPQKQKKDQSLKQEKQIEEQKISEQNKIINDTNNTKFKINSDQVRQEILKQRANDIFQPQLIKKGKLTVKVEKAQFSKQKYDMYIKYCKAIHEKDEKGEQSFTDFLCQQALNYDYLKSQSNNLLQLPQGCYHMNYYLEDKFIAVGVVDIFQECMSSVYFFYDPDYQDLSLGVVGAIIEIQYIQQMQKYFPSFSYYYLGFYIQSCQKMVYKGDYEPSDLLCPETYTWVPLNEQIRQQIDAKLPSPRLSDVKIKVIDDMNLDSSIEKYINKKTKISIQGTPIQFEKTKKIFKSDLMKEFIPIASGIKKSLYYKLHFSYN